MPRAFFDGAEKHGSCGCGFHILADEDTQFLIFWNGGRGTNNMAEAMALAGLLNFCLFLNLQGVSIYGDSKVMVDFVSGKKYHLQASPCWMVRQDRFLLESSEGWLNSPHQQG